MPRGGRREGAGRPVGSRKDEPTVVVYTRVPASRAAKLDAEAARTGETRSTFLRRLLEAFLDRKSV